MKIKTLILTGLLTTLFATQANAGTCKCWANGVKPASVETGNEQACPQICFSIPEYSTALTAEEWFGDFYWQYDNGPVHTIQAKNLNDFFEKAGFTILSLRAINPELGALDMTTIEEISAAQDLAKKLQAETIAKIPGIGKAVEEAESSIGKVEQEIEEKVPGLEGISNLLP